MKIYLDPNHKWTIIFEYEDGKKNYCAIPPTNGNRTDIILGEDHPKGYRLDIDCIIIQITNGEPKILL